MRRPTRTRRLSIAAIVSLLAAVVVAGAGVRSLWSEDSWQSGNGRWGFALSGGCAHFNHCTGFAAEAAPTGHFHFDATPDRSVVWQMIRGFRIDREAVRSKKHGDGMDFVFHMPVWPLFLLLVIPPVRWLIARSENVPAFPVITKQP